MALLITLPKRGTNKRDLPDLGIVWSPHAGNAGVPTASRLRHICQATFSERKLKSVAPHGKTRSSVPKRLLGPPIERVLLQRRWTLQVNRRSCLFACEQEITCQLDGHQSLAHARRFLVGRRPCSTIPANWPIPWLLRTRCATTEVMDCKSRVMKQR